MSQPLYKLIAREPTREMYAEVLCTLEQSAHLTDGLKVYFDVAPAPVMTREEIERIVSDAIGICSDHVPTYDSMKIAKRVVFRLLGEV